MLVPPAHWSSRRLGETLILTSPGGGTVAYDERVRPIDSIVELVKAAPPPAGFVPVRAGPIQELVTREGEYGALMYVEGRVHDSPAELAFGFVVLDDFYSRTLGVVKDPDQFQSFRAAFVELIVGDAHMLGRVRRRRFRYTPPASWTERRSLFVSRWLAPAPSLDPRTIVVGPALPKAAGLREVILAGLFEGADPAEVLRGPSIPVSTAHGLSGERWQLGFGAVETDVVLLEDDCFLYPVRLDTRIDGPAGGEVLHDLVESIRPIPQPAEQSMATPFGHWTE